MSSPSTRKESDFTKLIMHGYEVELTAGSSTDFYVTFEGPSDTLYEGGMYKVHVELTNEYPFASPSIAFEPYSIYHPNIDERSGSVCLDVINQTWTPMYSLVNIFDVFLPQLLTYPNPADPLNSDAASMLCKEPALYKKKVSESVQSTIRKHEERQREREMTKSFGGGSEAPTSCGSSGPLCSTRSRDDSEACSSGKYSPYPGSSQSGTRVSSPDSTGKSPSPNLGAGSNVEPEESVEFYMEGHEDDEDMDAEFE